MRKPNEVYLRYEHQKLLLEAAAASDYLLYVVLNAVTQPELHIIQNPAERTNPEEKIEARYMVSLDEIREKGAEYSKESRGL